MTETKTEYVKIKLGSSPENRSKGFYLLMTNGNTASTMKDEFTIEKRFLKLLDDHKIVYTPIH